jgi:ABC-type Zn uptake system ZnuABC Zn-binding protein ZnuA
MIILMRLLSILVVLFSSFVAVRAAIPVVAAENFYGAVAKTIGGDQVSVTSILTNPDQITTRGWRSSIRRTRAPTASPSTWPR